MSVGERIPNTGLKLRFHKTALEEIEYYIRANPIEADTPELRDNCIEKVFVFTMTFARHVDNNITTASLNTVQSKFPKDVERELLFRNLLRLLLVVIEQELGIRAPELGQSTYINQEVPQLTPDSFLNSQLANRIYTLIDTPQALYDYIEDPLSNQGFIVLWLCLKEGIDKQQAITTLLLQPDSRVAIEGHWLFAYEKKRYWLSTKAELILHCWYSASVRNKLSIIRVVNSYLSTANLLPLGVELGFIELRQMLKLEYIMTCSSMEYGLSSGKIDSTVLPLHVWVRLLTDVRVDHQPPSDQSLSTTVRQSRSWSGAFSTSCVTLRSTVGGVDIMQQTTAEQVAVISRLTKRLTKANRKDSIRIRQELISHIHPKLENPQSTKKMPWAWLILSWLYHLLKHGGKHKDTLRLDTIRAYVDYVSAPFIAEFAGCDPSQMDSLDWAEKLNDVIARITSVTKKAYVVYFAKYLIDSELVANLCLSDIDLPVAKFSVDANLISHHEADRIIQALEQSNHPCAAVAKIIFVLAFYTGLRRNEITGLQFKDFHHYKHQHYTLHVRPNRYRLLKSTDSSRNLPLDALIPSDLLDDLLQYLQLAKGKFIGKDTAIFNQLSNGEIEACFRFLTTVLKGVTGDYSLRFHHCRHAFCNWVVLKLYDRELHHQKCWRFLNHPEFGEQRRKYLAQRLGLTTYSRKKYWAAATLLGHATPATTASSYFHLVDFMRRNLFADHTAELTALRKVWGQGISFDLFGRVVLEDNFISQYERTSPNSPPVILNDETFDIHILKKANDRQLTVKLDLKLCWRVIRRRAENQSLKQIADGLNLTQQDVLSILDTEKEVTQKVYSQSKHKARSLLNYDAMTKPHISVMSLFITRYVAIEHQLVKELKLSLLEDMVDSFVGAKDGLIRTANKDMALTMLRFLKLMSLDRFEVKVKWYMANLPQLSQAQLAPFLNHIAFWKGAIVEHVELPATCFEVIIPKQLGQFKRVFEQYAATTCSDDGKFIAYHSPGVVSIHVRQTRFLSDRRKEPHVLPSRPRRTKVFLSFLRLLLVYWSLTGNTDRLNNNGIEFKKKLRS